MGNQQYSEVLITMAKYDLEVRKRLAETGELFNGYNSEMEKVHTDNAKELGKIINAIGWPTKEKVGVSANQAAWLIVQHAISLPDFQRLCLKSLGQLSDKDSRMQFAYLYDRIKFNERQPQRFGTQFDWDENGEFSPWELESTDNIDDLRNELELPPIQQQIEYMRKQVQESGETAPINFAEHQKEIRDWALKTGWIS